MDLAVNTLATVNDPATTQRSKKDAAGDKGYPYHDSGTSIRTPRKKTAA